MTTCGLSYPYPERRSKLRAETDLNRVGNYRKRNRKQEIRSKSKKLKMLQVFLAF